MAVTVTSVTPAFGPEAGGNSVVVAGTEFKGSDEGASTTVDFGGELALNVVVSSATEITVEVPPTIDPPGLVDVRVTTDLGTDTLGNGYTYVAAPDVTSVAPATGSRGDALTITGANFVSGATVTLGGVACTDVVFVSSAEITCRAPSHALGLVALAVTNPDAQIGALANAFTFIHAITPWGSTIAKLFPPGKLWNFEAGSALQRLAVAIGDEFARVQARGADLIEESDPRTASETLADWEEMLALPDELVTAIPATTAGRRVAIAAKYAARGGQSLAFFTTLCAACGYPLISITRYAGSVLWINFEINDLIYGDAWAYAMTVTVSPATAGALTHAQFEAVVRKATHSHVQVVFVYT